MVLNTASSKVTSVTLPHISMRFALHLAVLEMQSIFKCMHRISQLTLTTMRSKVRQICSTNRQVPTFNPVFFTLWAKVFK